MVFSLAFNLGFQTKHILNPWSMLFYPVKVPLRVFSSSCKVHSVHCVAIWCEQEILARSLSVSTYMCIRKSNFTVFTALSCMQIAVAVCTLSWIRGVRGHSPIFKQRHSILGLDFNFALKELIWNKNYHFKSKNNQFMNIMSFEQKFY